MVDSHRITEQASLLSHQAYAEVIDKDHSYLGKARAIIFERLALGNATTGEEQWSKLLQLPWDEIRQRMLDDTPNGRLLRSNSPFSVIIGISDPDMRRKLWRRAKHDLSATALKEVA